jgi:DNA polymerase sigma
MQPKFSRKTDTSALLLPKYDHFIRLTYRTLGDKVENEEKIKMIKNEYLQFAKKDILKDNILIDRLTKLKEDLINNGQKHSSNFIQGLKLLLEAKIIYEDVFEELSYFPPKITNPMDVVIEKYRIDVDFLVEKVTSNKEIKDMIKGIIKTEIDSKDSIHRKLKCIEDFEKRFKEIDWSELSHDLEVKFRYYGSMVNKSSVKSSDVDISLDTSKPFDERTILQHLYEKAIIKYEKNQSEYTIEKLTWGTVRVPLIDLSFNKYGIKLSFTVNNILGVHNSNMINQYLDLDPRARILCLLIKIWANLHGIISAKKKYLSSYAYNLMIIGYLQTEVPAILPSLQKLTESQKAQEIKIKRTGRNGNPEEFYTRIDYENDVNKLDEIMKTKYSFNNSDIIELMKGFFKMYGSDFIQRDQRLSIREGRKIRKNENDEDFDYLYSLEDPFDPYHNPGNYVRKDSPSARKMIKVMMESFERLEKGRFKDIFQPLFA